MLPYCLQNESKSGVSVTDELQLHMRKLVTGYVTWPGRSPKKNLLVWHRWFGETVSMHLCLQGVKKNHDYLFLMVILIVILGCLKRKKKKKVFKFFSERRWCKSDAVLVQFAKASRSVSCAQSAVCCVDTWSAYVCNRARWHFTLAHVLLSLDFQTRKLSLKRVLIFKKKKKKWLETERPKCQK